MKKSLSFLLALVLVFSFTLGAAANPVKDDLPSAIGNRNVYLTITHLTPGLVRFSCGWHMDNAFGYPLYYVVGVKNMSSNDNVLIHTGMAEADEKDLDLSFRQVLFPADDYGVTFYV